MPTLLEHIPCTACGHRHHFFLQTEVTAGREYGYVCPETGRSAALRPSAGGKAVEHTPQGAVYLTPAKDPLPA